jgi:hypothetical protein
VRKAKSDNATSPWGTPNPREVEAYPKPSTTSARQWAWEFLRRRPDYRVRWEQKVRPFLDADGDYDQAAIDRHHDDWVDRARPERSSARWSAPWAAIEEEFKVESSDATGNGTLDPRSPRPPLFAGERIAEIVRHSDERPPNHPLVILEFDLRRPIGVQLEKARRFLLRRKARHFPQAKREVKLQVAKFPRYLRLLDFEDLGTPDREIGSYLFPHASGDRLRDAIRKTWEAANRWQADYLDIALHGPAVP